MKTIKIIFPSFYVAVISSLKEEIEFSFQTTPIDAYCLLPIAHCLLLITYCLLTVSRLEDHVFKVSKTAATLQRISYSAFFTKNQGDFVDIDLNYNNVKTPDQLMVMQYPISNIECEFCTA